MAGEDIIEAFGGDRPAVIDWDRIDSLTDEEVDKILSILEGVE